MKQMNRKFMSVLLCVLMAAMALFAFAACGGSKEISGIEITTPPTKTDYVAGEKFDPAGMAVSLVYKEGEKEALAATDYTYSPTDALTTSNGKITVTYEKDGKTYTANQTITVHNKVVSVTLKQAATKTGYVIGEVFDPTGMILTAKYENGEERDVNVTADNVTYDKTPLKGTETEVKVTYSGIEVSQAIEFATAVTLKTPPTKTSYIPGESFNPAGMVLEVTYKSGKKADITVSGSSATYPTRALTVEDTTVTVTYGGFEVKVNITFVEGVFIEAENGIIEGEGASIKDDAVEDSTKTGVWDDKYLASGGRYVSDVNAGDKLTFIFTSETAGKGHIAFRLAGKYLRQDSNWTPIWMDDCQFNKMCKFSVNGVEYDIPDSAILPGGGSENGEPNFYLWFNWQEVAFDNISFVQGRNEITLEFIRHDYTCSQSSFNNTFGANVDSLVVTSSECKISPCVIKEPQITSLKLEKENSMVYLALEGTVQYNGYTLEEVKSKMLFDVESKEAAYLRDTVIEFKDDHAFTIKAMVGLLPDGDYAIHLNQDDAGHHYVVNVTSAVTLGKTTGEGHGEYTLAGDMNTPVTLTVAQGEVSFDYKPVSAEIEKGTVDGKDAAIYVIHGTYTASGYTDQEIIALMKTFVLDLQANDGVNGDGDWGRNAFYAYDVQIDNGNFTTKFDITRLTKAVVSHYGGKTAEEYIDFKPEDAYDKTIVVGEKSYRMQVIPDGSAAEQHFGCVGVIVGGLLTSNTTGFDLEVKNGKATLVISGAYTLAEGVTYSKEQAQKYISEKLYADLTGSPEFSKNGAGDGYPLIESTFTVEVGDGYTFKVYIDLSAMTTDGLAVFLHFSYAGATGTNLSMSGFEVDYNKEITVGSLKYKFFDSTGASGWTQNLLVIMVTNA